MRRPAMPDPEVRLPAMETGGEATRRIVRDELSPVMDMLEEILGRVSDTGYTTTRVAS